MAASFVVPSIFSAIDRVTRPVRSMQRSVSKFGAKAVSTVHRVDRGFIRLGRSLNKVAGGFGLVLGAGLVFSVLSHGLGIIMDYEQANANLASVLGKTVSQTVALQKDSQRLGATTAFTASQVAGLQTEYAKLGFTQREILGATEATLSLAAATNTELPQAAAQVGAAIRAFGLEASEAVRVSNVFASATSKSALDMTKLDVAMSKVAPVAKQFGFSIEDTTALMGKLADAGFDASTMATSTRSIILNLSDSNGKLAKSLGKPARNLGEITSAMVKMREKGIDLADMLGVTDKRSVAAFATLLEQAEGISVLGKEITGTNAAQRMAAQQMNTLKGRVITVNSAYEGFILSLNEGNSSFSRTLKTVLDVTAEVLNMASGFATAESEMNATEKGTRRLAESAITVIKALKWMLIGYVAIKAVLIASRAAYAIYSVALGISTALQWKSTFALKGNKLAMVTHAIVTKAAAAAQWLMSAAVWATLGPILLIIAAVVALGVATHFIIKKWDEWGAAVSLLMGPLGMVISVIQSLRRNWDLITASFKGGGILKGIQSIGLALVDALLQPLEQAAKLIEKFTGLDLGVKALGNARISVQSGLENLAGVENTGIARNNSSPVGIAAASTPVNSDATIATSNSNYVESIEEKRLKIDINDESGRSSINESGTTGGLDVNLEQGFSFL